MQHLDSLSDLRLAGVFFLQPGDPAAVFLSAGAAQLLKRAGQASSSIGYTSAGDRPRNMHPILPLCVRRETTRMG
ncbi:MAG: hypothetical protein WB561_15170 [Terracidiphilus sp.]